MKKIMLALILILASLSVTKQAMSSAEDGNSKKMEIAVEMIKKSADIDVLYNVFNGLMMSQIEIDTKNALQGNAESAKYITPLVNEYEKSIKEIFYDHDFLQQYLHAMAKANANFFNQKELQQMLDFYSSPIGQKMKKNQNIFSNRLQERCQEEMTQLLEVKLKEKFDPKYKQLQKDGIIPID